jgi:uncharacterized lipoprotein YehR (DUF1307 family)
MTIRLFAVCAVLALAGCTDTERAKFGSYGESGHIVCYSGGQKVVDDWSTGRVQKEDSGADGYAWKSQADSLLHESNADCVVIHGAKR